MRSSKFSKTSLSLNVNASQVLTQEEMARLLTLMRRAVKVASISSLILENGWRPYPGMGRRELELSLDGLNDIVSEMASKNDIIRRKK